ncbi:platelet endothelial aggregation receptor 1-like isoform X2 [Biomphalaria glabrata]|uniref:Platelet endothelial aggregation receptor 1-like isoform X2 n=1 Tax=Biomphalaria glabrata TaxID=6526 RepID=A0A9W3ABB1_BIOGL|nr:platelet endothelial aggregation receptor 1-like isoform X2 [Biomphalaria glabrata]
MTSALTNKSITFLLCEVEAYTECSEGTWGEHCKNDCNEKCPDMCRFDDGLCSNTCFGYSDPPRCKKACEAGTWGLNCTKSCSKQCFNSSCDRQTGLCDQGCLGYSNPPQCNIVLKNSKSIPIQTIIIIAVSVASAALLSIVICIIVLRLKGKLCLQRRENVHQVSDPPIIPKLYSSLQNQELENNVYEEVNPEIATNL